MEEVLITCDKCGGAECICAKNVEIERLRHQLGADLEESVERLQRENAELQSNNQLLAVRLDSTIAKLAAAEAALSDLMRVCKHTCSGRGNAMWAKRILSQVAAIDAAKTEVKAKHPEGLCGHIGCDCYEDAARGDTP